MPTFDSDATAAADPFVRRKRTSAVRAEAPIVAAVAAGGAIGATARYAVAVLVPTPAGAFHWTTVGINISGCALMGALMVAITELWVGHRLLCSFLGTGLLGGYTTFSTFAGDVDGLAVTHPLPPAMLYLVVTPVAALIATWTAAATTRRLLLRRIS